MTTREQIIAAAKQAGFEHWDQFPLAYQLKLTNLYEAGRVAEREECAKNAGEFARKWWSIHCATNRHLETTRTAHDDFCALQIAIRARS